ncbi:MAG: hypothetical protein WA172_13460 [Terriglobales bacterium]
MASSTITRPPSLQLRVAEETPERIPPGQFSRLLPGLTAAFCIAFGLAQIANTQLACDGGWFLYAVLHHGGTRLYRDLHLVLQPLAVLETEWWMSLVGKGWIVSKVPAVFHLVAFTTGIALVTSKSKLASIPKAIVIACVFFVGIHFEAYRFDDYHVMTDALSLFSILLLLKLDEAERLDSTWKLTAALGLLSGLAITTRLTDGVALCLATALAIAYIVKTRKLVSLIVFFCITCLVLLGIVALTGDSLRDYATSTILHAAGPKGGLASVLTRPFLLLWNSLAFLAARQQFITMLYGTVAAASWTWLVAPFSRADRPRSTIKAAIGLALLAGAVALLWPVIQNGDVIVTLSAVWVIAEYSLVFFLVYRIGLESLRARCAGLANPKRVIFFLPFALLLAGSLSSAGYHFGLYAPIAFLILVAVVVFPTLFETRWLRSCFLVIAALMAVSGAYSKVINPASWHSYRSFPMFSHRVLAHHPTYGTMIIDDNLHGFIEGICSVVKSDGKPELLSIPFSYANYYCDIPPWQGFVQSFFDLSGKDVIDDMMTKLQRSPPKWILYQRQLENLAMHEKVFNNGKRLPQRDLDEFMVANVVAGRWKLVLRGQDRAGTDWLLLRTD